MIFFLEIIGAIIIILTVLIALTLKMMLDAYSEWYKEDNEKYEK